MSLQRRLLLACGILAAGVVLHQALLWHLSASDGDGPIGLRAPLAALPAELGPAPDPSGEYEKPLSETWQGVDHPGRAEVARQVRFADEFLLRAFRPGPQGPVATLYAVYSKTGEDRMHHPEVCVRDVSGAPEDFANRKVVLLDGREDRPVQRFRFRTGTNEHTVIYYWHYGLSPAREEDLTLLQRIHRRHAGRQPSVTVQVSTKAGLEQLDALERSFLVAVDRELRASSLPPVVTMGCDRVPIALIR